MIAPALSFLMSTAAMYVVSDFIAHIHVESDFKMPAGDFYRFWFLFRFLIFVAIVMASPAIGLACGGVMAGSHQVFINTKRRLPWWNLSNSPGDDSRPLTDEVLLYLARQNEKVAALIQITLASLAVLLGGARHFGML